MTKLRPLLFHSDSHIYSDAVASLALRVSTSRSIFKDLEEVLPRHVNLLTTLRFRHLQNTFGSTYNFCEIRWWWPMHCDYDCEAKVDGDCKKAVDIWASLNWERLLWTLSCVLSLLRSCSRTLAYGDWNVCHHSWIWLVASFEVVAHIHIHALNKRTHIGLCAYVHCFLSLIVYIVRGKGIKLMENNWIRLYI